MQKTTLISAAAAVTAGLFPVTDAALGADGTWNVNASGNWSTPANWLGGAVADGADATANFTFDISPGVTVANDVARTIGNLNFDDLGAASDSGWTVNGPAALTLATAGGTSAITNASANGGDVTLGVQLAGANGVVFNNTAVATSVRTISVLNASNTYTGATAIQNGFVNVGANSVLGGGGPLGASAGSIILGTAGTTAVTTSGATGLGLIVTGVNNAMAQNFSIARNIDSTATANVRGRTNVRFNNGNAAAIGTLTFGGNWQTGTAATRDGYGLVAQRAGLLLDATGVISGGNAAVPFRINDGNNGNGTVRLGNAGNSFAGRVIAINGTLLIAGAAAAASGVLGTNGVMEINDGATPATGTGNVGQTRVLTDGAFNVAKTISLINSGVASNFAPAPGQTNIAYTLGGNAAGASAFSGAINTAATATNRVLGLTAAANGSVEFGGVIGTNAGTGVLDVTKLGAGTVILSGSNAYEGATTVAAGALLLNNVAGSATGTGAAVNVNAGTLGGTGSSTAVASVGDNAGTADAFLAPGSGGIESLDLGGLTLGGDATFAVELNSSLLTADRVNVATTGSVNLGAGVAALSLSDLGGATLADGIVFTILDNQGAAATSGTFAGLPDDFLIENLGVAGNDFRIDYDGGTGNDVTLTSVVPEPASLALIGLGGLALLRRRRAVVR